MERQPLMPTVRFSDGTVVTVSRAPASDQEAEELYQQVKGTRTKAMAETGTIGPPRRLRMGEVFPEASAAIREQFSPQSMLFPGGGAGRTIAGGAMGVLR